MTRSSDAAENGPASPPRDHGGGLDAAVARYGGARSAWLDLSTGINPRPYPVPALPAAAWCELPDAAAEAALVAAARRFWSVPPAAGVLAAPGSSALIARLPHLRPAGGVDIPAPTYNEHAAAFAAAGWSPAQAGAEARVVVNPNNPDGRVWTAEAARAGEPGLLVIDESFCDLEPQASLVALAARPGVVVLKSLGKFWGLAGLRLGFAIGDPEILAGLAAALGPWPVSGPALAVGRAALADADWAAGTRARLAADSGRLDALMGEAGAATVGGTGLFRLYDVPDAVAWQSRLARGGVWTRVFPYSDRWLRLGLPGTSAAWRQLSAAL